MKECLSVLVATLIVTLSIPTAHATQGHTTAMQYDDTAYLRIVTQRAARIVAGLGISDTSFAARVRDTIAHQYCNLNAIYTRRDDRIRAAKGLPGMDPQTLDSIKKSAGEDAGRKIAVLHGQYLDKLSKMLSPQQVEGVKDGMTYNVLHVTYRGYQEMLPDLTQEQKARILADLTEAREHAMDAESSEKKHAWFGKYKGRINNYLSAAGIDMKKASHDWIERMKEKKDKGN
jgi:hypothetical protein